MTLEKIINNEMIKDRTKEIRQIKTELKQLGMLRRYVDNETLGRAVNS